jgi:hypothetical protein
MTYLKVYIDTMNPLQDGTSPFIIELLHKGQQHRICTPHRFTQTAPPKLERGPVHYRHMDVVNDSQDHVVSSMTVILTSIKNAIAHLEASGKNYEIKDILHLAGLPLQDQVLCPTKP